MLNIFFSKRWILSGDLFGIGLYSHLNSKKVSLESLWGKIYIPPLSDLIMRVFPWRIKPLITDFPLGLPFPPLRFAPGLYGKSFNADGRFCFVPSINITLILHRASVSDSHMKEAVYHIECCKTPHKGNYLADCFSLDILVPFLDDTLTLLNQDGEQFSHMDLVVTRLRIWSRFIGRNFALHTSTRDPN